MRFHSRNLTLAGGLVYFVALMATGGCYAQTVPNWNGDLYAGQ
jgi:hypothetical protein